MATQPAPDPKLLVLATVVGMLAIVALPLTAALAQAEASTGRLGASLLAFATPATLLVAGRVQRRAWMMSLGLTLAVLLLPIVVLDVVTGFAVVSIFVGPIVAAIAVGVPLRDADLIAVAGFLLGGTIAVIGGSAAAGAGPATAAAVVAVAATVGVGVAAVRLLTPPDAP